MSNHSNNSVAEMMQMQFETVWGLKTGLETMFKKEAEAQRKEEEKSRENMPSIPSVSSLTSGFKMPSMPSIPKM